MTERALPVTILEPAGIDPELLDHTLSLRFDLGQFDPRITFTRNSSATYFGSDGLLKTASANEPRIDYDPVTGECKGFLVEESRTNLLTYSEQFDNATWAKVRASITTNVVTAPDGTLTADKLVENSSTGGHYIARQTSVTSGTTYTESWFVKSGERSSFLIACTLTTTAYAGYDLTTGTVTTQGGAGYLNSGIQSIGNGWFRVHLTFVAQATEALSIQRRIVKTSGVSFEDYTGDGTSGVYIWGAQLEAGAFPTSYIKTEAAAVTRAADSAVMTGANFSSWYRQDEGTIYSEWRLGLDKESACVYAISGSSSSNVIRLRYNASGTAIDTAVIVNEAPQAILATTSATSALNLNTLHKNAMAYKSDDFARSVNGESVIEDLSGMLPTVNVIHIGSRSLGSEIINGHIKRIAYYPKRISNAKLQALTQ